MNLLRCCVKKCFQFVAPFKCKTKQRELVHPLASAENGRSKGKKNTTLVYYKVHQYNLY